MTKKDKAVIQRNIAKIISKVNKRLTFLDYGAEERHVDEATYLVNILDNLSGVASDLLHL